MTFTTHAWLLLPLIYKPCRTLVISLVFSLASSRIPSSTLARRASCSFRCHAPFSMLSSVFIHRTDDRKLGGMLPLTEQNFRYSQLAICYYLFSLVSFLYKYGEERLKKRTRCHLPWYILKERTFLTSIVSVYVFFRRGML